MRQVLRRLYERYCLQHENQPLLQWIGVVGALAFPMQSAMAIAPLYMANVWAASGNPRVVWAAILAGSIAGAAGYLLAVLSWKRQAG